MIINQKLVKMDKPIDCLILENWHRKTGAFVYDWVVMEIDRFLNIIWNTILYNSDVGYGV